MVDLDGVDEYESEEEEPYVPADLRDTPAAQQLLQQKGAAPAEGEAGPGDEGALLCGVCVGVVVGVFVLCGCGCLGCG